MSRIKHSIKKQYSCIFWFLLFGAICLVGCFNLLTLGRFYLYHKQNVLLDAFGEIDKITASGDFYSDEFDKALNMSAAVNNIDIIILDSDTQTIKSTSRDARVLSERLLKNIFNKNDDEVVLQYENSKVHIQRTKDAFMKLEFLELWGVLSNNNLIFMRTPVQSIQESVAIANKVLLAGGIFISILGFIIIWFISSKLTKPIMNLVKISEKMTKLDFSEKYSCGNGNEIDVLGDHINHLSENLEKTIVDLQAANVELKRDIDKKNEMDEMRKDFISNVSHELKTPIALVQGYAEGLKDCVNDDPDSRDFYCEVIIDEANKMNRLVRNLLDLNELEFGRDNLELSQFDIVELIYNCCLSYEIMVRTEGITLQLPKRDDRTLVWADEFKVEHILNNYLSNALHYAKGKKEVRITISKRDSGIVRIGVYNSGDNIPENIMPNIWDKFFKADKARTREYGGSGIGLSIVKASMEALGHAYGVENREDGVEFWFELATSESFDRLL